MSMLYTYKLKCFMNISKLLFNSIFKERYLLEIGEAWIDSENNLKKLYEKVPELKEKSTLSDFDKGALETGKNVIERFYDKNKTEITKEKYKQFETILIPEIKRICNFRKQDKNFKNSIFYYYLNDELLGRLLNNTHQLKEYEKIEDVIKIFPNEENAIKLKKQGNEYFLKDDLEKAIEYYGKALELETITLQTKSELYLNFSKTLFKSYKEMISHGKHHMYDNRCKKTINRAIDYAEYSIINKPSNEFAYAFLCQIHQRLGDFKTASPIMEAAEIINETVKNKEIKSISDHFENEFDELDLAFRDAMYPDKDGSTKLNYDKMALRFVLKNTYIPPCIETNNITTTTTASNDNDEDDSDIYELNGEDLIKLKEYKKAYEWYISRISKTVRPINVLYGLAMIYTNGWGVVEVNNIYSMSLLLEASLKKLPTNATNKEKEEFKHIMGEVESELGYRFYSSADGVNGDPFRTIYYLERGIKNNDPTSYHLFSLYKLHYKQLEKSVILEYLKKGASLGDDNCKRLLSEMIEGYEKEAKYTTTKNIMGGEDDQDFNIYFDFSSIKTHQSTSNQARRIIETNEKVIEFIQVFHSLDKTIIKTGNRVNIKPTGIVSFGDDTIDANKLNFNESDHGTEQTKLIYEKQVECFNILLSAIKMEFYAIRLPLIDSPKVLKFINEFIKQVPIEYTLEARLCLFGLTIGKPVSNFIELIEQSIKQFPKEPEFKFYHAIYERSKNRAIEAYSLLSHCLRLDSNNIKYLYYHATSAYFSEKVNESIESFDKFIKLSKYQDQFKLVDSLYIVAMIFNRLGQINLAEENYQKGLNAEKLIIKQLSVHNTWRDKKNLFDQQFKNKMNKKANNK